MSLLVEFFRVRIIVGDHGYLIDTFIGGRSHLWVQFSELRQPHVFKGDSNGKIDSALREGGHLVGSRFVNVRIGSRRNHDRGIHEVSPDLLDNVFLGRDAYEDGNRFAGCGGIRWQASAKQKKQYPKA
jgi:hypothetical protein